MSQTKKAVAALLATLALGAGVPAHAAGNHHSVDDAKVLDRGECELESWFTRARGGERQLHGGTSCRVGPFELGVAAERVRGEEETANEWSLEAKWAKQLSGDFSIGLDVQPVWQSGARPRFAVTQAVALATWTPRVDLALHLNLGRDFVRKGADMARGGVAAEWSPASRWWLVAERYLEERTHFVRGGIRWEAGRNWSLDLSRAWRLAGPEASSWTLGITIELGDD